jgi:hypothetical protein
MSRLATWEDQRLFEADRAVAELVKHPGWAALSGLLADCRELVEANLKYGQATDSPAEQARVIGRLTGLEAAQSAVEAIGLKAREKQSKLETQEAE